eukprot:Nitzschia sp. Nitz4//scaffold172_size47551//11109//11503//NITZ4_007141-RA/size47551-augustus-gene-0.43-mRNA-1//-1//CDS//3329538750//1904//frame0
MFALARTSAARVTGRRMYSEKVVNNILNKPVWLADISTYPVMIICSTACVGAAGYITYLMTCHPDVQVDKDKRGATIRYW